MLKEGRNPAYIKNIKRHGEMLQSVGVRDLAEEGLHAKLRLFMDLPTVEKHRRREDSADAAASTMRIRFGYARSLLFRVLNVLGILHCRAAAILEEAPAKRTWLPALKEGRRCVVPASFFYEWHPVTKQPFYFGLKDRDGFGIGGFWEKTDDGIAFVLLTTKPSKLCEEVHDRMPLILKKEDEEKWTDPKTNFDESCEMIQPYPAHLMTSWPVSKAVSGIHNDGEELIKRADLMKPPKEKKG